MVIEELGTNALNCLRGHPKVHFGAWLCHQKSLGMWRKVQGHLHHLLLHHHTCTQNLFANGSSFDSDEDDFDLRFDTSSKSNFATASAANSLRSNFTTSTCSSEEHHVYACPHLGGIDDDRICFFW